MSNLNDFTKKELIALIDGLCDVIAGRVISHKEVAKRLKLDVKDY